MAIRPKGTWRPGVVQEVMDRYELCRDAYMPYWRQWRLAQEYVNGNQWVNVDDRLNVSPRMRDDDNALKLTFNVMRKMVDATVAFLVPDEFSPATRFTALNQDAKRRARAQDRLLDETSSRVGLTSLMRQSARDMITCGIGIHKILWRPMEDQDWQGRAGELYDISQWGGYIHAYSVHPLRFCPAPWSTKDSIPWVIEVHVVHKDQLEEEYPRIEGVTDGAERAYDVAGSDAGLPRSNGARPKYLDEMYVVYEMYELPTRTWPKGRFIKCTKQKRLYDSTNDRNFPGLAELPYAWATAGNGSGNLIGFGMLRDGIDSQSTLNELLSDSYRKVRQALNAPWLLGDKTQEPMAYAAGKAIKVYPGETPPQEMAIKGPPAEVGLFMQTFSTTIKETVGLHDPFLGGAPKNIESGRGLDILKAADSTSLKETADQLTGLAGKVWRRMLIEYRAHATQADSPYRTIDKESGKEIALALSEISEYDVRVDPIPGYLQSRPAYQQKMLQLWQLGVLQACGMDAEVMLDAFDLPSAGNAHDDELRLAAQENDWLVQGILCAPDYIEPHPLHIKVHLMWLLSDDARMATNSGPEGQAAVARVKEHMNQHARMMQTAQVPPPASPGQQAPGSPVGAQVNPGIQGAGPDMTSPLDSSGVQTEEYQSREPSPSDGVPVA